MLYYFFPVHSRTYDVGVIIKMVVLAMRFDITFLQGVLYLNKNGVGLKTNSEKRKK